MLMRASLVLVFLLAVTLQAVLCVPVDHQAVLTRNARQVMGSPLTRVGIANGMRQPDIISGRAGQVLRDDGIAVSASGLLRTGTVGLTRATALPIIGSPFVASTPLGPNAFPGPIVGTIGGTRAAGLMPAAGTSLAATRQLGVVPSRPEISRIRSTVGTVGRTRSGIPGARGVEVVGSGATAQVLSAVAQPASVVASVPRRGPSPLFLLNVPRPLAPTISQPGILRAGRSLPEIGKEDEPKKTQTPKEEEHHHRIKRQYFKPSIDGSMLSNDRSYLLKASNESNQSSTTQATAHDGNSQKKPKITVPGLIRSLFQLFDRIKLVLKKALDEHESE